MLTDDTIAFLFRCGVWALMGWAVWSQPAVQKTARAYQHAWVEAWRVDAGDCDVKAYGLLFKRACAEPD